MTMTFMIMRGTQGSISRRAADGPRRIDRSVICPDISGHQPFEKIMENYALPLVMIFDIR